MNRNRTAIVAFLLAALVMTSAGCARARNVPEDETTQGVLPIGERPVQRVPSSTPKQAVTSYLAAIPDAYYSLEVTVVAPFVTERQEVREDAYIELNRQKGQALEMQLVAFQVLQDADPSTDATMAVIRTAEAWRWRYWGLSSRQPSTKWVTTRYEVEYSLERMGRGWLVASTRVVAQSGETTPAPLP
ncbi:MAG: hypothetical protein N3B11_06255 [Coriobacteriia bacterium]|nr:hypothetical protein [Coriobacteriia bacterium]